jgi:hypothetical protein
LGERPRSPPSAARVVVVIRPFLIHVRQ